MNLQAPAHIDQSTFSASLTSPIQIRISGGLTFPGTLTVNMKGGFTSPNTAAGESEYVLAAPDPGVNCFGSSKVSWTATKS